MTPFRFLNDGDGNPSTMRVMCFIGTIPAALMITAMAYRIAKGDADYAAMAVLLAACAAYMGTLQYGKVAQTKVENAAVTETKA